MGDLAPGRRGPSQQNKEAASRTMKYALVDLGSNTIRMSIYDARRPGGFQLLFSQKKMAGLVNYISCGVLSQEGINVACQVLQSFQWLLRQFGMTQPTVFATASLRNISNTEEAVEAIRERTGLHVDVISGEQEAELGYYGAQLSCDGRPGLMFDIGGGSTELTVVRDGQLEQAVSYPIGSLNLFNHFVSKLWPNKDEIAEMQAHILHTLKGAPAWGRTDLACGIGGTARAALKIANLYFRKPEGNRTLTVSELDELTEVLLTRKAAARKLILNSCPDRVHTILPGILVMNTVASTLCRERVFISKYGVREGYLCRRLLTAGT